MRRSLPKT